jgi:Mycothiol maleylpyruvate isomerase N-terminal domain
MKAIPGPSRSPDRTARLLRKAGSPMTDTTAEPQPGVRTQGDCDFDPRHLLHAIGRQRQPFVAVLRGFGPGGWAAPTRCADWSAHDIVRHLCDANRVGIAAGHLHRCRTHTP